ncbi:MAG: hypothetical protein RI910_915 [Verrucomicrobiota bacterium]|jgi:hypothetical protein
MIDASIYLTTDGAPVPVERDLRPKADSLLIVPLFLKHIGGPMAGPAYLKGAGERAGHAVTVLDLNRQWIQERITSAHTSGLIKGDHDKPSKELSRLYQEWQALCASHWPTPIAPNERESKTVILYASHEEVVACASSMARGSFGEWTRRQLMQGHRPDLVGLSVMFSGQVIGALAITAVVRELWPEVPVVWGGAHVTALAEPISRDAVYGQGIDGFVVGYAERTWVELLDSVASGNPWPKEVFAAGTQQFRAKEDPKAVPAFDLSGYGAGGLTLPVQASRGCAYGKCAFCTYPKIEGKHRKLDLAGLETVIQLAAERDAVLSFKDSLLVLNQLIAIGDMIKGRVMWSACTKLHPNLNVQTMKRLHAEGLRTLEVGLETLDESSQELINKPQKPEVLTSFLDAAAESGVAVVINYMTGLPGADAAAEAYWLKVVRDEVASRPALNAMIEHNTFQLEMISPMGLDPQAFGIEVVRRWPWSSLLEYRIIQSSAIAA